MASLPRTLSAILQDSHSYSKIYRYHNNNNSVTTGKYLEIPVNKEEFEVPVFALDNFIKMLKLHTEADILVARLYSCGVQSTYKTFDSALKDVLSARFDDTRLCKILIPNSDKVYYGTFGAIFNAELQPLMMLSWIIGKEVDEGGNVKYSYKKPLLRLHPDPCINKEDVLQKMLAGRMLSSILEIETYCPYSEDVIKQKSWATYRVKVEIDEFPFTLKAVDIPSISVTNESLLQIAADHIDELLQ